MEAAKKLPQPANRWLDADFDLELMNVPPERRLSPDQLAHLRRCVAAVAPALEEARRLRDMPKGRFPIVYARNPLNTRLEEEQQTRGVRRLLELDAIACAEAGDAHGAMSSCRAGVNTGRAIGDEPTAISQLIRIADVIAACKTTGRVLSQTEPEPTDLKDLQELLEDEDAFPYWAVTWRGERAFANAVLEALESGDSNAGEMTGDPPDWEDRFFPYVFQDNVRACHPQLFKYMDKLQAAADAPPRVRGRAMQQVGREVRQAGVNMATLFLPGLLKMDDAFSRCHAVARCYATALAAERYRRRHGDWPDSLDQLTPDLIAAVPSDPFTGDALLYRRLADGVVIYSVSTDGVDDGGAVDAVNPTLPGADLGIRLWDPAKRRQPPEPPAAPPPRRTAPDPYACRLYQSVVSRIPSSNGTRGR